MGFSNTVNESHPDQYDVAYWLNKFYTISYFDVDKNALAKIIISRPVHGTARKSPSLWSPITVRYP